jgi:hypothetical protein
MEDTIAEGAGGLARFVWKSPKILLTLVMAGVIVYVIQKHKETLKKLDLLLDDRGLLASDEGEVI